MKRVWFAVCCGLATAGCGARTDHAADSVATLQPARVAAANAAADSFGRQDEPKTGLWTVRLLVRRLVEQGMKVVTWDSVVRYEYLSVPGQHIRIGHGDVQAFIYPDSIQPKADVAKLDTATAAPPGKQVHWPAPVTLVRSLNLVAILLIDSPGHSERVANGILGGPPPPEHQK